MALLSTTVKNGIFYKKKLLKSKEAFVISWCTIKKFAASDFINDVTYIFLCVVNHQIIQQSSKIIYFSS